MNYWQMLIWERLHSKKTDKRDPFYQMLNSEHNPKECDTKKAEQLPVRHFEKYSVNTYCHFVRIIIPYCIHIEFLPFEFFQFSFLIN